VSEIKLSTFDFETERLRLRSLDEGDEALFHGLYTDPETMRFIAPPLSMEQAAKSFRKVVARQRESSLNGRFLAILEKATRQPVGICGTSQYDVDALRVEVGIVLTPEARARGFAREALTALMKGIFSMSPVDEIRVRFSTQCPAVERLNITVGFRPCADELGEEGALLKRIWSVHRSSWFAVEITNGQGEG
jgi:RimJ/RimL family protein N-acetyltransferase